MIRLSILIALLCFFNPPARAQVKSSQTVIIKTPDILCEFCKVRVETYLLRHDGLIDAVVNFRKGETRVKFLTNRTDIEFIKTLISNCGFDADDVTADPVAYHKLPITCKKKSDGGGHPEPKIPPTYN